MRSLVVAPGSAGERRYLLRGAGLTLGRQEDNDVVIPHLSMSRHHARVWVEADVVRIEDRASKNGTYVNGVRVERAVLHSEDEVRLGDVELLYTERVSTLVRAALERAVDIRSASFDTVLGPGPSGLNLPQTTADRDRVKLEVLLEAAEQLGRVDSVDRVLQRVVDLAARLLDVDRVVILLANPESGELHPVASRGGPTPDGHSRSIAAYVAERRTAALFADAQEDERLDERASIVAHRVCSAMASPLLARESLIGVLYLDNLRAPDRFTEEDLQFLGGFAGQAALAIENAQLYARVEREAATRQNLLRFFPDTVAQRLLTGGAAALAPVECTVTALFCDLTDYTGLGGRMPPLAVLELLQVYFQATADIVFRHEGTLEKFAGDAVMAIWGAPFAQPDAVDRALRAAVDMQRVMEEVNRRLAVPGVRLSVHIGVNTGPVAAGNIGSARYLQFAAIGDATTLAARLCGHAKEGEILVGDATRAASTDPQHVFDSAGALTLKGREGTVESWRLRW